MVARLQVQNPLEEIVARLIRLHGTQLLKRVSRVLGQAAVAEEVVQDTYERLLRWPQLERMRPEERKAVMFTTGYRLAIDRVRRAKTAARGLNVIEASHAAVAFESLASPERHVMAQQAVARLTEAIDSLPERLREPMVLRYIEDLSRQAICARLGIAEDNLDQRIREARAICHQWMAHAGFDWLWLG